MKKYIRVKKESDYAKLHKLLRLRTTESEDRACQALERLGLRFLVDFGYKNAKAKMREELRKASAGRTNSSPAKRA